MKKKLKITLKNKIPLLLLDTTKIKLSKQNYSSSFVNPYGIPNGKARPSGKSTPSRDSRRVKNLS